MLMKTLCQSHKIKRILHKYKKDNKEMLEIR